MKNKITDGISLKDGIGAHGYVVIRDDSTGKILLQKSNMVVETGRSFVYSLFVESLEGVVSSDSGIELSTAERLDKCVLGTGSKKIVEYTDTDLNERLEGYDISLTDKSDRLKIELGSTIDEESKGKVYFLKFQISGIKGNGDDINITELGLFLNNGDLFSRITFDPIPFSVSTSFSLDYYIYF